MKSHSPGFVAITDAAKAVIEEMSVSELLALRAQGASWVVVDVREDREWSAGRIPGAVHMGKGVIERDAEATWPDPSTPLVLYCGGGYRSALAAKTLGEMGYTNVRSLAGGRRAWLAADGPWTTAPVD